MTGSPQAKKEPPKGEFRKPYPVWVVTTAAFVLPGSGQVLNGNAIRGIVMQFFMLLLGFITYEVTTPDISLIGRIAGGIAVYVISVIDANNVARRRAAAWQRIVAAGGPEREAPKRPASPRPSASRKPAAVAKPSDNGSERAAVAERPEDRSESPATPERLAEPPAPPTRRS